MPSVQGKEIQTMAIERSNIQFLDEDLFANTSIRTLYLDNSRIDEIGDGVFGNINNLKELYLHKLSISDIPGFANVSSLEKLSITDHKIETLQTSDFVDVASLVQLDIKSGALSRIEKWALSPLVNLTTLELYDNDLTELPDSFLPKNSKLKNLILK